VEAPVQPHGILPRCTIPPGCRAVLDQYLGRGIVGGSLYSFTAHGAETAKLVLRLLAGAVPPQTLTEVFSNKVMFDWRQMRRWGLSEGRLPPAARSTSGN
jgi:hypothetical protein